MKVNRLHIVPLLLLLFVAGCHNSTTDTKGPAKQTPTDIPELPYVLEGDYTPEVGVMLKVLMGNDTCFVMVDSLDDDTMHGHYYHIVAGSDSVHCESFEHDRHWRDRRKDATVYIYQEPNYTPEEDALYRRPIYRVKVDHDIEYGQALGFW